MIGSRKIPTGRLEGADHRWKQMLTVIGNRCIECFDRHEREARVDRRDVVFFDGAEKIVDGFEILAGSRARRTFDERDLGIAQGNRFELWFMSCDVETRHLLAVTVTLDRVLE